MVKVSELVNVKFASAVKVPSPLAVVTLVSPSLPIVTGVPFCPLVPCTPCVPCMP